MKLITLLMLFFVAQQPFLKMGDYIPLRHAYGHTDEDRNLTLRADGTFERRYYQTRMCLGRYQEHRRGIWRQNSDTLILTDTLCAQLDVLPYVKGFNYEHDSLFVWTGLYLIQPGDKLTFLNSLLNNMPTNEQLPDFMMK
jgi:hypothetical protein